MEEYENAISELKRKKNELLEQYINAGAGGTGGNLLNEIKEVENKIEALTKFLNQKEQRESNPISGYVQSNPLAPSEQHNELNKVISLFLKKSSTLSYKSTIEDFKELLELKTAFVNEVLSDFIGKATYDPVSTSKFSYIVASRIYSLDSLDDSIKIDIQSIRNKESEAKWHDRAIIATSLSLSLIQSKKFDYQKADFLLDFISDFEEMVWQRALTGLILALLVNENKWQRFERLKNRLVKLQEIKSVQDALFTIEYILRNNRYKYNLFDEKVFSLDYFKNNPLHFFLPFYKENEILKYCFDNSKCSEITYDELIEYASSTPFLDSYKYSLFLGLCDNSTRFEKIKDEHKEVFLALVRAVVNFYPFYNLISEYYYFYKYYPTKYVDEFINAQTTIYDTKLRNVIFNNFNRLVLNADKCMRGKRFNAAIVDLEQAISIYQSEDALYNLAICYIEKERYQKAGDLLEKIALNNSSDKNIKLMLARCYRLSKKYVDAQEILETLILDNPDRVTILLECAKLKSITKQNDEAIKYLQQAESISPNDIDLLETIGNVYHSLKDFDNSLKYHLKVKSVGPKNKFNNIIDLAHDYEALGDFKLALSYASKAIDMKKTDPYSWMLRGRIYFIGQIDIEKANKELLHSLRLSKVHVTYGNLGHVELVKGNQDLALHYYKECVLRFNDIDEFIEKYNSDFPHLQKQGILQENYEKIRDEMIEFWHKNDKIISDDEIEMEDNK